MLKFLYNGAKANYTGDFVANQMVNLAGHLVLMQSIVSLASIAGRFQLSKRSSSLHTLIYYTLEYSTMCTIQKTLSMLRV